MTWHLECNHCGYRLPDGAAASPKCHECGKPMNIHNDMQIGSKVKLRGRAPAGTLKAIGNNPTWIHVDWETAEKGPKWVNIRELESVREPIAP